MSSYIKQKPEHPSFQKAGYFDGYVLSQLRNQMEIDYIDMYTGHDYYGIEEKNNRVYYILEGEGMACINQEKSPIKAGDIIEIPAQTESAFVGRLKMLEIMQSVYNPNEHRDIRKNDML